MKDAIQTILDALPAHKGGLTITHNENASYHKTVETYLCHQEVDSIPLNFSSPEDKAIAIKNNELWTLQWYPDTPVGFQLICASSLL